MTDNPRRQSVLELLVRRDERSGAGPGVMVVHRVVHEISRSLDMHRLTVDGVVGAWTHNKQIAACGDYRASTDHFAPALPRIFIALDARRHQWLDGRAVGEPS